MHAGAVTIQGDVRVPGSRDCSREWVTSGACAARLHERGARESLDLPAGPVRTLAPRGLNTRLVPCVFAVSSTPPAAPVSWLPAPVRVPVTVYPTQGLRRKQLGKLSPELGPVRPRLRHPGPPAWNSLDKENGRQNTDQPADHGTSKGNQPIAVHFFPLLLGQPYGIFVKGRTAA